MCNPWSRSASNYSEICSDNNGRGTLCPSDIGNKWKANVSQWRMISPTRRAPRPLFHRLFTVLRKHTWDLSTTANKMCLNFT